MRKIKAFLCLILVVALSMCVVVGADAAEPRASAYLSSYAAYMGAVGDSDVVVCFEVFGTKTMDEIGALDIILQEKAPGSTTWTTVATYWHSENPGMLITNDTSHVGYVTYDGVAGYIYRAQVTIWAGRDGSGDSRDIVTPEIIAR